MIHRVLSNKRVSTNRCIMSRYLSGGRVYWKFRFVRRDPRAILERSWSVTDEEEERYERG